MKFWANGNGCARFQNSRQKPSTRWVTVNFSTKNLHHGVSQLCLQQLLYHQPQQFSPSQTRLSLTLSFCANTNTANDISTMIIARKLKMPLDSDFFVNMHNVIHQIQLCTSMTQNSQNPVTHSLCQEVTDTVSSKILI